MKKYLTDVIITNRETGDMKYFEKKFKEKIDAINYRQEILDNMLNNCYSHWAKVYPVIKCHCEEKIECINFTNTCDNCGADYNFDGILLASRSQWGEETGEDWWECY